MRLGCSISCRPMKQKIWSQAYRLFSTAPTAIPLVSIEPFEMCSVKPPTENHSISFRLTRGCYWLKCQYCMAGKLYDEPFSKRTLQEVKKDIDSARRINALLEEQLSRTGTFSDSSFHSLVHKITSERIKAGLPCLTPPPIPQTESPDLAWMIKCFKVYPTIEGSLKHVYYWRTSGGKTAFLGDSDCMVVDPKILTETLVYLRQQLPSIQRVTIYGKTRVCARGRTVDELRQYKQCGLDRVHFGVESGSDEVLRFQHKGCSKKDHIQAAQKINESGLSCGVYIMPGLGGARMSVTHAKETVDALNQMNPQFVRLRSLQVVTDSPLEQSVKMGEFVEASEEQMVEEIRYLVQNISCDQVEIVSDSAANLLPINGRLPFDRADMLREIDEYLDKSPREKLEFNFIARLQSFLSQYGSMPDDIATLIQPHLNDAGYINPKAVSDDDLKRITKVVRSRLMP